MNSTLIAASDPAGAFGFPKADWTKRPMTECKRLKVRATRLTRRQSFSARGAAMLRVLTLSTLFPNAVRPTLGVFVERQTLGLAGRDDVELEVVAPVGLPLWPLSLHPHYAALGRLPLREQWQGLIVHRPRYRVRSEERRVGKECRSRWSAYH